MTVPTGPVKVRPEASLVCFVQLLAPIQGFSQEVQAVPSPSSLDVRSIQDRGEGKHEGSRAGEDHHASIKHSSSAWTKLFPNKPPALLPSDTSREGAQAALAVSSPSPASPGTHTLGSGG